MLQPKIIQVGDMVKDLRNGLFGIVAKIESSDPNMIFVIYKNGPFVCWQEYSGWYYRSRFEVTAWARDGVENVEESEISK